MADIKNYGLTGVASNIQLGKSGGFLSFTENTFSLETNAGSDADLSLGNATVSGLVSFGDLTDGVITIEGFIDDNSMETASNTTLATSGSVKAYIDAQLTASSFEFTDDSSTANLSIDLDSETLTFAGGTNITTLGSGKSLTISLDDNVTLAGNLSAVDGTFSGDLSAVDAVLTGNVSAVDGSFSGDLDAVGATLTGDLSAVNGSFSGNVGITGDLTVTGNIIGSGGEAGSITGLDTIEANNIVAAEDITLAGYTVNGVIDDDSMATASNTTLATSESVKAYVDAEVAASSSSANISLEGDTGAGTVNLETENLEIAGTANEIETSVSGNVVTIGLPDNVTIGSNLTVTNDASISGALSVTGDAVITGNLTVNGTQTIVNTETVNIEDNIIRVNTSGTGPSAGLEANIGGTIESMVYDPNASLSPDSNDAGAWVFSDDVIATSTLSAGNLQTTGTATVGTLTDGTATLTGGDLSTTGDLTANVVNFGFLNDGVISIDGFDNDPTLAANSATVLATQQAVKTYIDGQLNASSLEFTDDSDTAGLSIDLDSETLKIAGGTNITTSGAGNVLTVDLDDDVTLAGNLVAVDGTFSGDVGVTGTATVGTLTDGTATLTGGEFSGLSNVSVGNININGNTISTLDTDGDLILAPNGSGDVIIGNSGTPAQVVSEDNQSLSLEGGASSTATDAGDLFLLGGDSSSTGNGGDVVLQAGTSTGGTAGTIQLKDTNDNVVVQVLDAAADSNAHIDVQAGTTGAFITADSTEANADITLSPKGSGQILVPGSYVPTDANSLVDKAYVDSQLTASSLEFTDDSSTAGLSIDLDSETLTIAGGTNITTSGANNTLTVTLDDDVTLAGNLVAVDGTFSGTITDGVATLVGGEFTTTGNVSAADVTASGTVEFGSLSDGTIVIEGFINDNSMATASNTTLATAQSVKSYVDAEVAASSSSANLSLIGDAGTGTVNIESGALTVEGTANEIETSVSGNVITVGLPNDIVISGNLTVNGSQVIVNSTVVDIDDAVVRVNSDGAAVSAGIEANIGGTIESVVYVPGSSRWELSGDVYTAGSVEGATLTDGTASLSGGELTGAGNITAAGAVQFGTLSDGTDSISEFITEADGISGNDNDTSVPTTAAVIDYVSNNSGDGLLLRGTFTADGVADSFSVGTVPNVSARSYYADKIVIKVNTAFSGGSFDHILVKDNNGAGTTLVASDDADGSVVATYVVELDSETQLTKNATVDVQFMQADGTTPAVVTAGATTVAVHYNWV